MMLTSDKALSNPTVSLFWFTVQLPRMPHPSHHSLSATVLPFKKAAPGFFRIGPRLSTFDQDSILE
jgi:hypothetical protein